jgi:rare lipoprotein A
MHLRTITFSTFALFSLLSTTSCTRLFKDEEAPAPPTPTRIKSGLISPAEGTPIAEPWAQSVGEGVYKVGKPYKVNGVWYFPKEDYTYDEVGYASWYGADFHNKRTANGEVFDMNMLSAAHKTLPLPSVIRVTNLQNGRSLILRVNDRGPFVNDRILDVSKKAAQLLGFKDQGTSKVRVELLPEESMTVASLSQNAGYIPPEKINPTESGDVVVTDELKTVGGFHGNPIGKDLPGGTLEDTGGAALFDTQPVESVSRREAEGSTAVISEQDYNRQLEESLKSAKGSSSRSAASSARPYQSVSSNGSKKIYVQAGAFGRAENAHRLSQSLRSSGPTNIVEVSTARGGSLYKVRVGPFGTAEAAKGALEEVVSAGNPDAHIITE